MLTRMYSECANFTNALPNAIKNISDFNAYALLTLGSNPLRRANNPDIERYLDYFCSQTNS